MPDSNFLTALRALHEGGVKFVIVGGLAAVLNGAPVDTFDLDIVPARDEANVARLLRVLDALEAIYRMQPERRLRPDASHLSSPGHHNLITNCGPLDVLGTIGGGLGYEDLLPHTVEMETGGGVRVRVLNLATIVALKEELAGEKDLAVLPILRRTLEQKLRPGPH
jgi:predicted nucleotidyltransferase